MTPQVHTSHCSLTKSVTEALRWKPESKMVIAIDAKGKGKKKKGGKKRTKFSETTVLPWDAGPYRKYFKKKKKSYYGL